MGKRVISGIHHVTAMSGPAQRNVDFYVGVLGLRLVKRTVNFDDPGTYHLYYGDREGTPGSIMTFFPWPDAGPGRSGTGTVEATGFAVGPGKLPFWEDRLRHSGCSPEEFRGPGGPELRVEDPDGMVIEISESESEGDGAGLSGIEATDGISSFSGVLLDVPDPQKTATFMTDVFGYVSVGEAQGRLRFTSPSGEPGSVVDLRATPSGQHPRMGRGSVHHVAFRAEDKAEQLYWQEAARSAGISVTGVMDRTYFQSIYFHEPGGVLFEVATDPPGFAFDESIDSMGSELKLPPWLEARRAEVAERLPSLVDPSRGSSGDSA
jgi:glyoxalase family protein